LDDFNNLIIEHLKIYQKDADKDLILAFHMIAKSEKFFKKFNEENVHSSFDINEFRKLKMDGTDVLKKE